MKEIDDTPLPETESEWDFDAMKQLQIRITDRMRELELRIAALELQRAANEDNQDDPEWN